MEQRPTVFISYSQRDELWKDRLVQQLKVLERQGILEVWDASRIPIGSTAARERELAIGRASVAILLITKDYLASERVAEQEAPLILERAATEARSGREGFHLVPVLVRPCRWQAVTWLSGKRLFPSDGERAIESGAEDAREADMAALAAEVHALLGNEPGAGAPEPASPGAGAPEPASTEAAGRKAARRKLHSERVAAELKALGWVPDERPAGPKTAGQTNADPKTAGQTTASGAADAADAKDEFRPRYADEKTRRLSEALAEARERQRALRQMGETTSEIDKEIKALSRELRLGGQLRAGDWLEEGRYLLLTVVGRGGFATVWKAHDRSRDELVAIKVLHSELAGDPVRRERFMRGARRMMALEGAGVVRLLEPHGEDDGFHYFVMELVRGGDLRQAVLEKRLGSKNALEIILGVGAALGRAHAAGVVHRDIKPANILLDEQGNPYLTDFDLVAEHSDSTGGTRTNQGLGTAGYAAPELAMNAKDAGPPADVYGLAITAAFVLRGADLRELLVSGPTVIINGLACSSKVKAVLLKAVALDPKARFKDANAFCEALRAASEAPEQSPRSTAQTAHPSSWIQRGRDVLVSLAGTALSVFFLRAIDRVMTGTVNPAHPALADVTKIRAGFEIRPESSASPMSAAQPAVAVDDADARVALASIHMVRLSGKRFQMGSPENERGRSTDEAQHLAEVAPFEMSAYEVTQKQWSLIMKTKPFLCDIGCEDEMPAQNVSWFDAIKFANALTEAENRQASAKEKRTLCYAEVKGTLTWDQACTGYRLPSESEWEYAARAGTATAYSFGSDAKDLCKNGNGTDLAANKKHRDWRVNQNCDDGYADLAPVGVFKPNPWGLHDMHGNVWEWVWDWYGPYPSESKLGYAGPDTGPGRVARGGSFTPKPGGIRSSDRYWLAPGLASKDGGFRIARGVFQSAKVNP